MTNGASAAGLRQLAEQHPVLGAARTRLPALLRYEDRLSMA